MVANLRWWLVFLCSVAGFALASASGHVGAMWRVDAYKVSFVTLITYFVVTVFVGRLTCASAQETAPGICATRRATSTQ